MILVAVGTGGDGEGPAVDAAVSALLVLVAVVGDDGEGVVARDARDQERQRDVVLVASGRQRQLGQARDGLAVHEQLRRGGRDPVPADRLTVVQRGLIRVDDRHQLTHRHDGP